MKTQQSQIDIKKKKEIKLSLNFLENYWRIFYNYMKWSESHSVMSDSLWAHGL